MRSVPHPLGPPWLRDKYLIDKMHVANEMFLFAISRLNWRLRNYGFCVIENPASSWGWHFKQSQSTIELNGVYWSEVRVQTGTNGDVEATVFLHNCSFLNEALRQLESEEAGCSEAQLSKCYAKA